MLTDYQRDQATIIDEDWDYTWSRTGSGGHTLTPYAGGERVWHRHYAPDGRTLPIACDCWED